MEQNKNIRPFDDFLRAFAARKNQHSFTLVSADKEAEFIFAKKTAVVLPPEKVNTLLLTLQQALSVGTLGTLVEKALLDQHITDVQGPTGLSPSLLDDIKADSIFANSIPVKSLVKLLKLLNITLEKALAAIDATFEKLNTENKLFPTFPPGTQPAFRKSSSDYTTEPTMASLKSDERYLYQNREALDKYTSRLGELYHEIYE